MTVEIVMDMCCKHYYDIDVEEMRKTHILFLLASTKGPKIREDGDLAGKKVIYFLAYEPTEDMETDSSVSVSIEYVIKLYITLRTWIVLCTEETVFTSCMFVI